MSADFVRRTQRLYDIEDELRKAEIAGNSLRRQAKLVAGLQESCLLIQDMLASHDLAAADPDPVAWQYFRDLQSQQKLDSFLELERHFLSETDLQPPAIDAIVRALERAVESIIMQEGRLSIPVRGSLVALANFVCGRAADKSSALQARPLLRRVFLAAGGSTVVLLNMMPPSVFQITPQVSSGSISLGVWLIANSAQGALDAWVGEDLDSN